MTLGKLLHLSFIIHKMGMITVPPAWSSGRIKWVPYTNNALKITTRIINITVNSPLKNGSHACLCAISMLDFSSYNSSAFPSLRIPSLSLLSGLSFLKLCSNNPRSLRYEEFLDKVWQILCIPDASLESLQCILVQQSFWKVLSIKNYLYGFWCMPC